jgi:hypothetical protein
MQNDIIEAVFVEPKTTVDVFVVMNRYGDNYWSACTSWKTIEEAQLAASTTDGSVQAWKIVKVSGLPVSVNAGEALVGSNDKLRGCPVEKG